MPRVKLLQVLLVLANFLPLSSARVSHGANRLHQHLEEMLAWLDASTNEKYNTKNV